MYILKIIRFLLIYMTATFYNYTLFFIKQACKQISKTGFVKMHKFQFYNNSLNILH